MAKPAMPLITLIYNKVLDKKIFFTKEQLNSAEKEFQEMCNICKVTKKDKDVFAIDEMIQSLKKKQTRAAETHAKRVHEAIRILESRQMTVPPKVSLSTIRLPTHVAPSLKILSAAF